MVSERAMVNTYWPAWVQKIERAIAIFRKEQFIFHIANWIERNGERSGCTRARAKYRIWPNLWVMPTHSLWKSEAKQKTKQICVQYLRTDRWLELLLLVAVRCAAISTVARQAAKVSVSCTLPSAVLCAREIEIWTNIGFCGCYNIYQATMFWLF